MNFNDEKGFTLVLSFIFITVLVILAGASASIVINENRISQKQYRQKQAYYLARAGAEYAIGNTDIYKELSSGESTAFKIKDFNTDILDHNLLFEVDDKNDLNVENDSIQVFIERNGSEFVISSLGGFADQKTRLSLVLEIISDTDGSADLPPLDYALFATAAAAKTIELIGSSTINGKVGTNAVSYDSLDFIGTSGINGDLWLHTDPPPSGSNNEDEWSSSIIYRRGDKVFYNGQIYTAKWWNRKSPPPGNEWEAPVANLNGDIAYLEEAVDYPEVKMPDFPAPPAREDIDIKGNQSAEISEDGSYDTISIKSNNQLIIDRAGGDRIISVKNLDIGQGHIKFKNPEDDGILKIYVENEFTLNGSSSINKAKNWWEDASSENVEIYYNGSKELDFGGNVSLNSSLFIEKADFKFRGSSSTVGYLFSNGGDIDISGDVSLSTIYAPNSNLTLDGSSSLRGSSIVSTFSGVGNVSIDYQEVDPTKMPEDFLAAFNKRSNSSGGESNLFIVDPVKWGRD
jgi:hypothetical protein